MRSLLAVCICALSLASCSSNACSKDSDCNTGYRCTTTCVTTCSVSSECTVGYACMSGKCLSAVGNACTPNSRMSQDCNGLDCDAATLKCAATKDCSGASDCSDNYQCDTVYKYCRRNCHFLSEAVSGGDNTVCLNGTTCDMTSYQCKM